MADQWLGAEEVMHPVHPRVIGELKFRVIFGDIHKNDFRSPLVTRSFLKSKSFRGKCFFSVLLMRLGKNFVSKGIPGKRISARMNSVGWAGFNYSPMPNCSPPDSSIFRKFANRFPTKFPPLQTTILGNKIPQEPHITPKSF